MTTSLLPLLFILTLCLTITALKSHKHTEACRQNCDDCKAGTLTLMHSKTTSSLLVLSADTNARQVEELVAMYNTYLTDFLDKHAPWRNVHVRDNTPHPWYDSDIDDAREKMLKLENVWRRSKLEIHRQLYVTAREECTALISACKMDYYQNSLEKN